LDRFIQRKREIIWRYDESFKGISELILVGRNLEETAPFFYVIRVREGRDELMSFLKERGIGSGVHYIPNHLHPVFTRFKVNLPVTEKLYREIVTLPLYYDMTDEQVEEVIKGVKEFFV
ncbi:DegT/DnrJ/EryC1/StrS family aminotransferase, partial [bacterium]|nr:DegT/DnrJ/EryC1/StrS family aminotransferase [bacterium]